MSDVGHLAPPWPGGPLRSEPGEGSRPSVPAADPAASPDDLTGEAPPAQSPVPLGVVFRATGNAEVDGAVARLADADALPTAGHVEVYEDVHRQLRDALTALDENRS